MADKTVSLPGISALIWLAICAPATSADSSATPQEFRLPPGASVMSIDEFFGPPSGSATASKRSDEPPSAPVFAAQGTEPQQGCIDDLTPVEALDICSKLIAAGTANAFTYKVRGNALYSQGKLREAAADFGNAIRLAPDWESPYFNESVIHYKLKDYRNALWDLKTTLFLNPKKAKAYTLRGHIYYNNSRYEKAIEEYSSALKYDPGDKDAAEWLQNALAEKERAKTAPDVYSFNITADSDLKSGRYKQAIASFTDSIKKMLDGRQAAATNSILARQIMARARARFAIGDNETAAKEVLELLLQAPATIYTDPDVVVTAARYQLDREPGNVSVMSILADALDSNGDHDEAVLTNGYLLESARNDFERSNALLGRSNALVGAGKTLEALRDLNDAIGLAPSKSLYINRAFRYSDLKDYDAAIADFSTALSLLDKNSSDYIFYLRERARTYQSAGKYDGALKDLDEILRISPIDARARDERIFVLVHAGKVDEARAAIKELKTSDHEAFLSLWPKLKELPELTEYSYNGEAWETGQAVLWCTGGKAFQGEKSISACTYLISLGAVNSDGSEDKIEMARLFATRGYGFGSAGEFEKALSDLDNAVSRDPEIGMYYNLRSLLQLKLGKADEAARDKRKACSLDKDYCK